MFAAFASALASIALASAPSAPNAGPGLFLPVPTEPMPLAGPAAEPTVLRARRIEADLGAMDLVDAGPRSAVRLNLFADADLTAVVDRVEARGPLSYTWTGRVASGGHFVLSVEDDSVMGAAWLDDGRTFEVRSDAAGRLWSTELRTHAFEPCATDAEHCVHARPEPTHERGGGCADSGETIDVLVAYTPAARNAAGGTNAIRAMAASAVASTNTAYENSQIGVRLRLMHTAEVGYQEGENFSTDLSRLRNATDGYMDEVHQLRQTYKADMVSLINDNTGACGVAYLMTNLSTGFASSAFSVTRHSCAVGNLTFAHELGHNMGSAHDRDNAGNALFSYSYGHRWNGTNGTLHRSVMAYSPGVRRPHFSNPNVSYGGVATGLPEGHPQAADNARSINQAAWTVANFRLSLDATAPELVMHPQSVQIGAGENAAFIAGAVGSEPLSYRWQFNGQDLADDGRISGSGASTLVVQNAGVADQGFYRVVVSNACGSVTSQQAELVLTSSGCPADVAVPFGVVDFFDLSAFLFWFNNRDPAADVAEPFGVFNFFDVSAYLRSFAEGCP